MSNNLADPEFELEPLPLVLVQACPECRAWQLEYDVNDELSPGELSLELLAHVKTCEPMAAKARAAGFVF